MTFQEWWAAEDNEHDAETEAAKRTAKAAWNAALEAAARVLECWPQGLGGSYDEAQEEHRADLVKAIRALAKET